MLSLKELVDLISDPNNILYNKISHEYIRNDSDKYFVKYDVGWRPKSIIVEWELYELYKTIDWVVESYDVVKPMSFDDFRNKMLTRHIHYNFIPYRINGDEAIVYCYNSRDKIWELSGFTLMSLYCRYTTNCIGFNFHWTISDEDWNAPIDPQSKRYTK